MLPILLAGIHGIWGAAGQAIADSMEEAPALQEAKGQPACRAGWGKRSGVHGSRVCRSGPGRAGQRPLSCNQGKCKEARRAGRAFKTGFKSAHRTCCVNSLQGSIEQTEGC